MPELIKALNPMESSAQRVIVEQGGNIAQIIDAQSIDPRINRMLRVWIEDENRSITPIEVPREKWHLVKPKHGVVITVKAVPLGGGGGGGKNPLATVLMIGIAIAAIVVSGGALAPVFGAAFAAGTTGAIAVAAGIGIVGGLLMTALVKPPSTNFNTNQQDTQLSFLTGTGNKMVPYAVIPRLYGKMRMFPTIAAAPYTEMEGDNQYLRMMLNFGYGPLEISDIKIGNTPIDEYDDIEYQIRDFYTNSTVPSLYANTQRVDTFNLKLLQNEWFTTFTDQDTNEILIDVSFPTGLLGVSNKTGKHLNRTVTIRMEYREVGASSWVGANYNFSDNRQVPLRRTIRKVVDSGDGKEFEVRVRRSTVDVYTGSNPTYWDSNLVSLRTVKYDYPINNDSAVIMALRVKATDQLNGVIDELSAMVEARLQVWDGSAWVEEKTRHPAWAYADIVSGGVSGNKFPYSQIDAGALKAWADATPDYYFDNVFDAKSTVFDMAKDVLSAGRARFNMIDDKFTLVRDVQQTSPIQHFTPINSKGFEGTKNFKNIPHGLKVKFRNSEKDYDEDTVIVYDSGYSESNATTFEELELLGITDAERAYKEGNYFFAVAKLRPEVYKIKVDPECMVCDVGSLVKVSHDVTSWGQEYGRITALALSGSDVSGVTVDTILNMESGKTYVMRIRKKNNTSVLVSVSFSLGENQSITFTSNLTGGDKPEVGDLILFGETDNESVNLIVTQIDFDYDFNATLTMVDEAPSIYTVDDGLTIPAFDTQTNTGVVKYPPAEVQNLALGESLRYENGNPVADIVASWQPPEGAFVANYEVYLHNHDEDTYVHLQTTTGTTHQVGLSYEAGDEFCIKVLAVGSTGMKLPISQVGEALLTTIGDITIPDDVLTFTVEESDDNTRRFWWTYNYDQPDIAGFKIRYNSGINTRWDAAVDLHSRYLDKAPFETQAFREGAYTILIKAVDTTGNESGEAAVVTINLGDKFTQNLVEEFDFSDSNWSGLTISGGTVDIPNDRIIADDVSGVMYAAGAALLYNNGTDGLFYDGDSDDNVFDAYEQGIYTGNPDAYFYSDTYNSLSAEGEFTPTQIGMIFMENEGAGNLQLEYRKKWGNPMYSNDDAYFYDGGDVYEGETVAFIPYTERFQAKQIEPYAVKSTVPAGKTRGIIDKLNIIVDAPDIIEYHNDKVISSSGTYIAPTRSHRALENVKLTVQDDGGTAVTAKTISKSSTAGAFVKCYDISGIAVAGLVDAETQGY